MRLVIAEKPSVAHSISSVLGARIKHEGYQEGNGYIVSWCFGHLAGLADANVYDPKYAKWKKEDLPILPQRFKFLVGEDKKTQFELLKHLMHREDVEEVINACDAGREGELIFRNSNAYFLAYLSEDCFRTGFSCLSRTTRAFPHTTEILIRMTLCYKQSAATHYPRFANYMVLARL